MEELNELDSTCGVSDDELTRRFMNRERDTSYQGTPYLRI